MKLGEICLPIIRVPRLLVLGDNAFPIAAVFIWFTCAYSTFSGFVVGLNVFILLWFILAYSTGRVSTLDGFTPPPRHYILPGSSSNPGFTLPALYVLSSHSWLVADSA